MNRYHLFEICEINPKKDIPLDNSSSVTFLPMEAVSTDGTIDTSRTILVEQVKNYSVFKDNDILFAKITPCMENGKGAVVSNLKNGYGAGSTEFIVLRPKDMVSSKWFYYFLSQKNFRMHCQQHMTGSAGQKRVPAKFLANCEIGVPTLEEQKRIVARIEELFSQLDSGVETLKKTKEQLAVYRQAVLKEAFSSCVERVSVESVCQHVTDGDHMPPPKTKQGIPFIMISNIDNHVIDWNNTAFVGDEYYNTIDTKRRPSKGDVLYTVTGSYGIPVLIDFEKRFCFQRHIALLRPKNCINQKFLYYAMQEPGVYAQATKGATGTAQKTVGLAVLRKIRIPFSDDIDTQTEIVNDIEAKLSLCDSIEITVDTALQQAEAMRQSILKKAFEGEL